MTLEDDDVHEIQFTLATLIEQTADLQRRVKALGAMQKKLQAQLAALPDAAGKKSLPSVTTDDSILDDLW